MQFIVSPAKAIMNLNYFEQLLNDVRKRKPSLSVITADFNARSSSWWINDINTTEGSKLYSFASPDGFLN